MQAGTRVWVASAVAAVLASFGVVTADVLLVGATVALWMWLLTHQTVFVTSARDPGRLEVLIDNVPNRLSVDEPRNIRLQAKRDDAVPVNITITPKLPASIIADESTPLVLATGRTTTERTFQIKAQVTGTARIEPHRLEFTDPGGFFTATLQYGDTHTINVQPQTTGNLHVGEGGQPVATRYGEHKAGRAGAGLEPYEVREYAPGDQLSRIDWKATARLGEPHIREYELTTTHETTLVVDHRASMGVGDDGETELDYLREVALAFVESAERFDDPLGLYTVGDSGMTTADGPAAGTERYNTARGVVRTLSPTRPESSDSTDDPTSPATARRNASRLADDPTPLGETLRPYFDATDVYVRRLADRPLFRTVQLARSQLRAGSWTVIITDDTRPRELREAAKLARRNDCRVLVFLAPSVLYEPHGLDDLDRAYGRYREFEEFRASLALLDRVTALEVAPGDRLETVVGRHRAGTRRRRGAGRPAGIDRTPTGSRSSDVEPATPPEGAADE